MLNFTGQQPRRARQDRYPQGGPHGRLQTLRPDSRRYSKEQSEAQGPGVCRI